MQYGIIDIINCGISILALCFSCLSLYNVYMSRKPYIKLNDMFFEPSDFHCYSLEAYDGHEKLTDAHKNIINKTVGMICSQTIDGVNYLLVNTIKNSNDLSNVRLVLAPYQFTYTNTGEFIHEISLVEATIKLIRKDKFTRQNINCSIIPEKVDEKFNIKVAYVCREGFDMSVIYQKLFNKKEFFSYKHDFEKVKDIINFEKEIYKIKCKNNSNNYYKIKLTYIKKENSLEYIPK